MDQQQRNEAAARAYNERKNVQVKRKFDKDTYHSTVAQTNAATAINHARAREANEMRILQLEEDEARIVENLQRTLQNRNQAMNELAQKSRSLKKSMEPRQAYKYKSPDELAYDINDRHMGATYSNSNINSPQFVKAPVGKVYGSRSKSIAVGGAPASGSNAMSNSMRSSANATQAPRVDSKL